MPHLYKYTLAGVKESLDTTDDHLLEIIDSLPKEHEDVDALFLIHSLLSRALLIVDRLERKEEKH